MAGEEFTQNRAGSLQKFEMLSKAFNNLTTRSNTFAVYATIGYFEVMNDGPYSDVNRPVLGKELGTDDGTAMRHRFFAVLDRTNLAVESELNPLANQQPYKQGQMPVSLDFHPAVPKGVVDPMSGNVTVVNDPELTNPPASAPMPPPWVPPEPPLAPQELQTRGIVVRIPAIGGGNGANGPTVSGYYDGQLWTLQTGSLIDLDINGQTERVLVQIPPTTAPGTNAPAAAFDPNTGTAEIILRPFAGFGAPPKPNFDRNHSRGALMRLVTPDPTVVSPVTGQALTTFPGHPGPQPGFQYTAPRYAPVVRYAERLQ